MNRFANIVSTFFGVGFFPFAPGTFATLISAIIYYFLIPESFIYTISGGIIFLLILVLLSFPLSVLIRKSEDKLGEDSGKIVIDEVIGYFISVLFLPKTLTIILLGFVLFRIFDIFKPEPVNVLQKVKAGWGVILDDVMAGIYANIVLRLILKFI